MNSYDVHVVLSNLLVKCSVIHILPTENNGTTITGFSMFNLVFWHTLIIVRIYVIENKLDFVAVTKTKTLENEDLRPKTRLSFRDYEN